VDHAARVAELVAGDRRGDAVEYFQSELVGIPEEVVAQLRHAPFRPALEAIAHTLVYDATIVADRWQPDDLAASITVPTLAVAAGAASPLLPAAALALEAAIPDARAVTLDGQTHDIDPMVLGPVLEEFIAR
jgi:pimeloyl-ACP methyl ester carboxylesterase